MKCENCKKDHDGSYGSGRFCSKKCARGFSTKRNRKEINKKVSKSLKGHSLSKESKEKISKAFKGKKLSEEHKKKISKALKGKRFSEKKIKYCKWCGSIKGHCKRPDICKRYTLFKNLEKFGFDKNTIGTKEYYSEYDKIRNDISNLYWIEELSTIEICKMFKYDGHPIHIFRLLNIPTRDEKNSRINRIKHHGVEETFCPNSYKKGWHTTWDNKKVFYRSSYELDFAKKLDEQKILYKMENLRILYWDSQLQKQRIAIPDFYLLETNEIIEIKSRWTYDKQNMRDKITAYREHGYKVNLYVDKEKVLC